MQLIGHTPESSVSFEIEAKYGCFDVGTYGGVDVRRSGSWDVGTFDVNTAIATSQSQHVQTSKRPNVQTSIRPNIQTVHCKMAFNNSGNFSVSSISSDLL